MEGRGVTTLLFPGFGFGPSPFSRMELGDVVCISPLEGRDTLVSLLSRIDKEGEKEIAVVGWSLGGYGAVRIASLVMDRLRCLVLCSIRRSFPGPVLDTLRGAILLDRNKAMKGFFRGCFAGQKRDLGVCWDDIWRDFNESWDETALLNGLRLLSSPFPEIPSPLAMKVHVLHGSRDIIAPVDEMISLPAGGRFKVVPAGHLPFLHPEGRRFVERAVWGG